MTDREQKLIGVLGVVLAVVLVGILGYVLIWQPAQDVKGRLAALEDQKATADESADALSAKIDKIKKDNPRLEHYKHYSFPQLPKGSKQTDEAYRSHLVNNLANEYQEYLHNVLKKHKFQDPPGIKIKVNYDRNVPRYAKSKKSKPIYRSIEVQVKGEASLKSVVDIFRDLYSAPRLQRIKSFSLTQPTRAQALDVNFTVEAILVDGAETAQEREKREKKVKTEKPKVLASRNRDYATLVDANLFDTYRPATPQPTESKQTAEERFRPYLKYVRLTGTHREAGRRWKATLENKAIDPATGKGVYDIGEGYAYEDFRILDAEDNIVLKGFVVDVSADWWVDIEDYGKMVCLHFDGKGVFWMRINDNLEEVFKRGPVLDDLFAAYEDVIPDVPVFDEFGDVPDEFGDMPFNP